MADYEDYQERHWSKSYSQMTETQQKAVDAAAKAEADKDLTMTEAAEELGVRPTNVYNASSNAQDVIEERMLEMVNSHDTGRDETRGQITTTAEAPSDDADDDIEVVSTTVVLPADSFIEYVGDVLDAEVEDLQYQDGWTASVKAE